jgi:hypothetical protein
LAGNFSEAGVPAATARLNSGEHRNGKREHGLGVCPDTWAELLRRSQAAGRQRIGVPTAAGFGSKQRRGSGHD